MSVFVDLETGHLEIGGLINESAIFCAHGDMFGHRHIEATAINEGASGLSLAYRSPTWIEEHGSASGEHKRRYDLYGRHLEGREFHDRRTGRSMNIRGNEGRAAAREEALMIPEIVVVALGCEPPFQIEAISGHHAARVRWFIGNPAVSGLLLEEPGTLNCHFISDFLSPGCDSKKNENNCYFGQLLHYGVLFMDH